MRAIIQRENGFAVVASASSIYREHRSQTLTELLLHVLGTEAQQIGLLEAACSQASLQLACTGEHPEHLQKRLSADALKCDERTLVHVGAPLNVPLVAGGMCTSA